MALNVSFWVYFYVSGEDSQLGYEEVQGQENCPYEMPHYASALTGLCKGYARALVKV